MVKLVNSSQFIVHRILKTVNREPIIVNRRLWRHGFTLIELLVVITIIAILISAASASWTNAQQRGRDGRRKGDLKAVQQALEIYMQTNGEYPNSISGVGLISCGSGADLVVFDWGVPFICNSIIYMQQLPKDPVYQDLNKGYYYNKLTQFTYILSADLENDNDQDRVTTGVPCTPQGYPQRDYCVINP